MDWLHVILYSKSFNMINQQFGIFCLLLPNLEKSKAINI